MHIGKEMVNLQKLIFFISYNATKYCKPNGTQKKQAKDAQKECRFNFKTLQNGMEMGPGTDRLMDLWHHLWYWASIPKCRC
jgi:hypothetical protein